MLKELIKAIYEIAKAIKGESDNDEQSGGNDLLEGYYIPEKCFFLYTLNEDETHKIRHFFFNKVEEIVDFWNENIGTFNVFFGGCLYKSNDIDILKCITSVSNEAIYFSIEEDGVTPVFVDAESFYAEPYSGAPKSPEDYYDYEDLMEQSAGCYIPTYLENE